MPASPRLALTAGVVTCTQELIRSQNEVWGRDGDDVATRRYTPEQIIKMRRDKLMDREIFSTLSGATCRSRTGCPPNTAAAATAPWGSARCT